MNIFTLLIIYQIKHFLCDYPLQGKFMLGKFQKYPDFILPLLAHSAVHAIATFLIVLCYNPKLAVQMGMLDGVVHFIVDRIKASPDLLGRFKNFSANEYGFLKNGYRPPKFLQCKWQHGAIGDIIEIRKIEPVETQEEMNNIFKSNTYFWWSLGVDQMAHHLTHYVIIWMVLK